MPLDKHVSQQIIKDIISRTGIEVTALDSRIFHELLPSVDRATHKGMMGHCLVVAGSPGRYGAAILASKAAYRSGAGLVTACIPSEALSAFLSVVPEAMTITNFDDPGKFDAIGFGPGTGTEYENYKCLRNCIESLKPLVIDADGITLLSKHPDLIELLHEKIILTPHEGEFDRLTGRHVSRIERIVTQLEWAKRYKVTFILKGSGTVVATPIGIFLNTSGNPGMATGGSGDVLTGVIAGLLAQGITPAHSALLGVYAHGDAGDRAAYERGERSVIAGDLVEKLQLK